MVEHPKLNPSFARLAFNVIRCILRDGVIAQEEGQEKPAGRDSRYWYDAEFYHREALKVYRVLRERYPDLAAEQPEFDQQWRV